MISDRAIEEMKDAADERARLETEIDANQRLLLFRAIYEATGQIPNQNDDPREISIADVEKLGNELLKITYRGE